MQAELLIQAQECPPDVVVMMQSFSVCLNDDQRISFFEELDCPVLQVPVALCSKEAWLE